MKKVFSISIKKKSAFAFIFLLSSNLFSQIVPLEVGTSSSTVTTTNTSTATVTSIACSITTINIPAGSNSATYFAGLTGVTGQNYKITGTFTVNSPSFNFTACNIIMDAAAKINVNSGSTLIIAGKTHIFSCSSMWDGIYVMNGAVTQIQNSSLIEDALSAVNVAQGGLARVYGAIFNKNYKAVELTSNTGASSPIDFTSCVVTSRNIPSGTTTVGNPTVSTVWTNVTSPTPYPSSTLLPPNSNTISPYGIYATDVNTVTVGNASTGLIYNGFDNLGAGIYLTRSNANIYNNKFQKMSKPPVCSNCVALLGTGVYALGTPTGTNTLKVGGTLANQTNSFADLNTAIDVINYQKVAALKNAITNSSTPAAGAASGIGQFGIKIRPAANNTIDVSQNSIINCATGVWLNRANTSSISTLSLKINSNSPITAIGTGYCSTAILVSDLLTGTTVVPTTSEIKYNVITESAIGICLSNVKKLINVTANSCKVKYTATGLLSGIKATGCEGLNISDNHTNYNVATASLTGGNITAYGIYLQNSTNMTVKCNTIEQAARSMVFEGNCTSSTNFGFGITRNTMIKAQDGFVLKNSGIIGQQGDGSILKSDNVWDLNVGNYFTFSHTLVDNSNAALSPLYVTNSTTGLATRPTTNIFIGLPTQYVWATSLLNSTGTAAVCGSLPPALIESASTTLINNTATKYSNELKTIQQDNTVLPVYNDAAHWQRNKFVYNEVKNNASLTSDAALNIFYTDNANTTFGKFASIDDKIVLGNYAAANTINSSVIAANVLEQNQQTINALILNGLLNVNYVYTFADLTTLYSIANQCPLAGGNAVYQARNLLMDIKNTVLQFEDNCNEAPLSMIDNGTKPQEMDEASMYKLYPNPNDGNMIFEYSLFENSAGTLYLYDVTGRLMSNYKLTTGQKNLLRIAESELKNGIYFYSVIVDSKVKIQNKIVIAK